MVKINEFCQKILGLSKSINEMEKSAIAAGFNDILVGIEKIQKNMEIITYCENNEEIAELLFDIHFELVNHIKPHIESMDAPLLKISEEI